MSTSYLLWWSTHNEHYTIFSHKFTTRLFSFFLVFFPFVSLFYIWSTIFYIGNNLSRMSSVVGQKGDSINIKIWKENTFKRNNKVIRLIIFAHPRTTKIKGRHSFHQKSNSSGISNNAFAIFIIWWCHQKTFNMQMAWIKKVHWQAATI